VPGAHGPGDPAQAHQGKGGPRDTDAADLSRTHKEIMETQKEQVGHLLAFLQNLRYQSSTYDHMGNLNRR